ncbi:hypothetical protein A2U01_0064167, partial [Trifolium medium]|nr:hypothetical protein [Trifolium medium]
MDFTSQLQQKREFLNNLNAQVQPPLMFNLKAQVQPHLMFNLKAQVQLCLMLNLETRSTPNAPRDAQL